MSKLLLSAKLIFKGATMTDWTTTTVAIAGIASPAWLPILSEISSIAALLMPILGVGWLGVQIFSRITRGK